MELTLCFGLLSLPEVDPLPRGAGAVEERHRVCPPIEVKDTVHSEELGEQCTFWGLRSSKDSGGLEKTQSTSFH